MSLVKNPYLWHPFFDADIKQYCYCLTERVPEYSVPTLILHVYDLLLELAFPKRNLCVSFFCVIVSIGNIIYMYNVVCL